MIKLCAREYADNFNVKGRLPGILREIPWHSVSPLLRWDSSFSGWVQCGSTGWLVGRSGYTGMQGLLFAWERSGSGGECHWWLQRGRKKLQEVFSLSLYPPLPPLSHSHSLSLCLSLSPSLSVPLYLFFFSVCENLHRAEPLSLRPRSPGTTTALSCPVNTHPSSTGLLRLPAPGKHRATAPILIHIAAPAWMMCVCVTAEW